MELQTQISDFELNSTNVERAKRMAELASDIGVSIKKLVL